MRRDAHDIRGQYQSEKLPVLRRGCQLRAAHGVHAGRAGQAGGELAGHAGAAGGLRAAAQGSGEGEGLAAEADRGQPSSGRFNLLYILIRIFIIV